MITRRIFAGSLAAATASAKKLTKSIGVQLYTARTLLNKDAEGTMKRIAELGYKEVELFSVDQITKLGLIAERYGMKPTSCHIPATISLNADKTQYEAALRAAKTVGLQWVGVPFVAPNDRGTGREFWKAFAVKLNRAAEIADKSGLGFFYHNHAFEFAGKKGDRVIDVFAEELNRKLVKLELDVFWVAAAGEDPVAVLQQWRGRVGLLHVKDRASSMAKIETESQAKPADFKEVGNGNLDFKAIFKAARKAGVDRYFVEQDQCPGDPIDSLKVSYNNLKKLGE